MLITTNTSLSSGKYSLDNSPSNSKYREHYQAKSYYAIELSIEFNDSHHESYFAIADSRVNAMIKARIKFLSYNASSLIKKVKILNGIHKVTK